MKARTYVALSTMVLGAWMLASGRPSAQGQKPAAREAGWITLFDGKSLKGWRGYKKPDTAGTRWIVQDGLLTLASKDGRDTRGALDIVTTDTFDRFELTWEWKIAEGGNSGLKYYVLEDRDAAIGHEYQIIDDARHKDAQIGPHRQTAALYDVLVPSKRPIKAAGEWNVSSVMAKPSGPSGSGTSVTHVLNGTVVLEYTLDSPGLRAAIAKSKFKDVERFGKLHKGHILLQDHGDQVWYRNIKIRQLTTS